MRKTILNIIILFFSCNVLGQVKDSVVNKEEKLPSVKDNRIYTINKYQLSSLEKDSIVQTILHSSLIEEIIKTDFADHSLIPIYEPSNQIYFIYLLMHPKVNSKRRSELLINKIIYDWSRTITGTGNESPFVTYSMCGNVPRPHIDTIVINSKLEAINEYLSLCTIKRDFSAIIFMINNEFFLTKATFQKVYLLHKLHSIEIHSITLLNQQASLSIFGSMATNGVIMIKGKDISKKIVLKK